MPEQSKRGANIPSSYLDIILNRNCFYFIIFPRKVAGKCVAEGLDVRQVSIHITPLGHYPLESADVVKISFGDKV